MNSATVFNDVLLLGSDSRSAFAALGYGLMTGDTVIVGMSWNQIEDLKRAYVDAFWAGEWQP